MFVIVIVVKKVWVIIGSVFFVFVIEKVVYEKFCIVIVIVLQVRKGEVIGGFNYLFVFDLGGKKVRYRFFNVVFFIVFCLVGCFCGKLFEKCERKVDIGIERCFFYIF